MKRNEIPIDLSGFVEAAIEIQALERRIEQMDRTALTHWLKLLPPPAADMKDKMRRNRWMKLRAA